MPKKIITRQEPVHLENKAADLEKEAGKLRAVAASMKDEDIESMDVSMHKSFEEAITKIANFTKKVEDAFNDVLKDRGRYKSTKSPPTE